MAFVVFFINKLPQFLSLFMRIKYEHCHKNVCDYPFLMEPAVDTLPEVNR